MDDFCGSEFWVKFVNFVICRHSFINCAFFFQNVSVTWDTDNPTLTSCFEQTVLVYTPCAFLWLFTLLEIYSMRQSYDKNIRVNFLNSSKLILTALITVLTICDLVYALTYDGNTYAVHFYTPVIKIATFVSMKKKLEIDLNLTYGGRKISSFRYLPVFLYISIESMENGHRDFSFCSG